MAIDEIREYDIGTVIEVEIHDNADQVVDISSATGVKDFIFVKPAGESFTKPGSFTTDGTDGLIRYVTTSGVMTPVGIWCYQLDLELNTGRWRTDIGKFKVHPNLT